MTMTTMTSSLITLAQGAPEKAPTTPWGGIGEEAQALASLWVRWAMYLGLLIAVCAGIILLAMMAIDRNRGEAGIASSDQARFARYALGLGFIACAPQIIGWFIDATPW